MGKTKLGIGFKEFTYEEILTRLKLYRLEERRLQGDLIDTFMLLAGNENLNPDNIRGHSKKLNNQQCMKLCRCRFFRQRVVGV